MKPKSVCDGTTRWYEPSEEQRTIWREWLEARPERVRMVAQRFDPWTVYRLVSTGQHAKFLGCDVGKLNCDQFPCSDVCRLPSGHPGDHDPEGRVTARVYVEHPGLGEISGRQVFGIDPDDLTPWTDADEDQVNRDYPWIAAEQSTCTGLTAQWCPRCGDCTCGVDLVELNDPGCPLHAPGSPHAELTRKFKET